VWLPGNPLPTKRQLEALCFSLHFISSDRTNVARTLAIFGKGTLHTGQNLAMSGTELQEISGDMVQGTSIEGLTL